MASQNEDRRVERQIVLVITQKIENELALQKTVCLDYIRATWDITQSIPSYCISFCISL
jgi:hypothetical protein